MDIATILPNRCLICDECQRPLQSSMMIPKEHAFHHMFTIGSSLQHCLAPPFDSLVPGVALGLACLNACESWQPNRCYPSTNLYTELLAGRVCETLVHAEGIVTCDRSAPESTSAAAQEYIYICWCYTSCLHVASMHTLLEIQNIIGRLQYLVVLIIDYNHEACLIITKSHDSQQLRRTYESKLQYNLTPNTPMLKSQKHTRIKVI